MKTRTKILTGIAIAALLVLALIAGGWFINITFAQGGMMGMGHNNQAVLNLLKSTESELVQERKAGKSWLDIATAKGVSEQALTDALQQLASRHAPGTSSVERDALRPMTQMHAWMTQNYSQSNDADMTAWMLEQFAQDIRVTQYGTMTDMHVFSGSMMGAMMGGKGMMNNGGMMNSNGMMGNGMMNGGTMNGGMIGGMMNGGMMGAWNNTPNVNATPIPSTQKVDNEIKLTVNNFKFEPSNIAVKKGETVKFTIANQDKFAHNVVSQNGNLAYAVLPANQTTSFLWAAPQQAGTYTVICTWHPGMQFTVQVE